MTSDIDDDGGRTASTKPTLGAFRWQLQLQTRNRDTDQFGHVNHAAIATLFEESRSGMIFAPALLVETALVDLLIVKICMTFHKELKAPGSVQIGSEVTRIGRTSIDIAQALFADSFCFASAEAVCVLLGKKTRRPAPVGELLRGHLLGTM